jgi:rhodanese-related sulfurtransferase
VKQVLLEALLVAVVGAALAFVANGLSPLGLGLGRDYFPTAPPAAIPQPTPTGTNAPSLEERVAARLKAKGLRLIDTAKTIELFHDARYQQGLVVFLDDHDDHHYQEGHIPGAYQFEHFHPEKYLATILPLCQFAEQIVVYCGGGDCEDSEFAATMLGDAGIPKDKLNVYGGGITEWKERGLPVELGARNSGQVRNAISPTK